MKHYIMLWLLILVLLPVLLAGITTAKNNGVTDQDLNQSIAKANDDDAGPNCGDQCHLNDPGGTISITSSPAGPYTAGQTNISINVTTKINPYTDINNIMGVMLVNSSNPGGNIKNNGWIIKKDANNNINPYNYNQKTGINLTINQTFTWNITAPAIDNTYYIISQARYGSIRSNLAKNQITSSILSMIVDGTPPSVTSNTNNIYVKTGTILTLNATITDALAGLKNATVNVTSVNSTINQGDLTFSNGFYLNTSIIADRNDTDGLKNLTITAYDNVTNVNKNINMTVGIDNTPPSKVTNFTNTTAPSHSSVDVSWNASTDYNGSGVKEYQIERTNDSFNYLTVPRDTIDASNVLTGYEQDAYWYTFKSNTAVDCTTCHGFSRPTTGNIFAKYDETYLYVLMHTPDNDSSSNDDKVRLAFDINKDGGTAPMSDDRLYQITENNDLTYYTGNGSGWESGVTNALSYVRGSGSKAPRYEIRIPLSEIGNPVNNTSMNFVFENECLDGSDFIRRDTYFPAGADEDNPNTWKTITFRNFTDYIFVDNVTSTQSIIRDLNGSYRYNFTVRALDNLLSIGERSDPLIIQTVENPAYNISGFLLNTLGLGLQGTLNIQDYIVVSDSQGRFNFTQIPNGTYIIIGQATGYQGNSTSVTINGSDMTNINVTLQDITPPAVSSNTNNVYYLNKSLLMLNASVTDAGSGVKNVTVNVSALNSTINTAVLTLQGDYWINSSIIADRGNSGGFVNLTITAYDNVSNINNSINMTIGIDNTPPLVISNTYNLYTPNGSVLTLNASITDAFPGVKNATVNVSAINSSMNEAVLTLSGGYWQNSTIIADKGESIGFINLTITAYDYLGNVNNSINMTVKIEPELTIIDWSNNITNDQSLNFTVYLNDSVRFNVTSNHTASYNWTYDSIDELQDFDNFSKYFSEIGSHYVNVTISSLIDTDHKNWTINVIYKPDLVITLENISFLYVPSEVENGEVKENVNVTVNVSVYNSGLGDATNINVSFYDGTPGAGNNIANATIANISSGESINATIYWNSIIGSHNISIKVDPENTLVETDDSNNNASKTINVSAWQKYYGNVSGSLTLRDGNNNSLTDWTWATYQGNVFITNIPYLNFNNLQALGRKKNGEIAMDNFSKADTLLNMTQGSNNATGFFNNNITQLFSTNGTSPRNYTNFMVYSRTIDNVAIVNSTNTTSLNSLETSTFITGILWDTSKDDGDGDYGDDGEDIVFISNVNVNKTGLGNSQHDYEIAIPSIIRNEEKVYFFVELK